MFQQDRWNDGGARGLAASWTTDGHTFHRSALPFSLCAPGGADFERASDPWVSTGPDGTVYASGEGVDFTRSTRSALLAATSRDGGRTWQNLTTTHVDQQPFFNDKPSLTADPVRHGTAYQVWNRLDNDPPGPSSLDGPGYISLTRDGGRTWSKGRAFVDTSTVPNTQTIGHVIVANRRTATLYDYVATVVRDLLGATGPAVKAVESVQLLGPADAAARARAMGDGLNDVVKELVTFARDERTPDEVDDKGMEMVE
ncbi:sialidase family protein [Streptomyces sp. NPDC101169]|uniref:sialidase family protein n=1 Tax=Streptomyces sp. NPDC101169 TaxID=3366121 RepID=UPI00380A8AEB